MPSNFSDRNNPAPKSSSRRLPSREDLSNSSYVGNTSCSRITDPPNLQRTYRPPRPGSGYDMGWLFEAANSNGPPREMKERHGRAAEKQTHVHADVARDQHRGGGTHRRDRADREGEDITEAPRPHRLGEVVASPYALPVLACDPESRSSRESRQRMKDLRTRTDVRADTVRYGENWIPMKDLRPVREPETPPRILTKNGKGKANDGKDGWDDVEL